MKRLFASKQALAPVATNLRDEPAQEYGNMSPSQYQSQPSPRDFYARPGKDAPYRGPARRGSGTGAHGYASYADQSLQGQPQDASGRAYQYDRGMQGQQIDTHRHQPQRQDGHRRDASYGRGQPQRQEFPAQGNQQASRDAYSPRSATAEHPPSSYAQPRNTHAPYSPTVRPEYDSGRHVDTRDSAQLQRSTSRSKKQSRSSVGGLFHRHQASDSVATPLRRQSTNETYQSGDASYNMNNNQNPPQRHASMSHRSSNGPRRDVPNTYDTSPTMAQKPESRYVDDYDDSRMGTTDKGSTQDKMRRFVFGQKRGKGPRESRSPKPMLDSDGEGSDEVARRPDSRGLAPQGPSLSASWEHVPSMNSSAPDMTAYNKSQPPQDGNAKKSGNETKMKPWSTLRDKKKQPSSDRHETDASIVDQIHHLVTMDEYLWEKEQLQTLCSAISHSEATARDAMQALRKELVVRKHDGNANVSRAVKLWACLYIYSSDRFKLQVANKKFLEALEDLYHGKYTSTSTQGRLLVAWSMIAHEASVDADLQSIVKAYNKMKPSDMPVNGTPLNVDHDIFQIGDGDDAQQEVYDTPAVRVDPPPRETGQRGAAAFPAGRQGHSMAGVGSDPRAPLMALNASQQSSAYSSLVASDSSAYHPGQVSDARQVNEYHNGPANQARQWQDPPSEPRQDTHNEQAARLHEQRNAEEQARIAAEQNRRQAEHARLHEECNIARNNAQVLRESLAENGLTGALVQEFGAKVRASQDFVASQIPYLSQQVDEARREAAAMSHAANGHTAATPDHMPEEQILDDFLDAHEKLITASSMLDEAEIKKREDDEEAQVLERSMREMRMDRSTLVRDTNTGNLYDVNNLPSDLDPAHLQQMTYDGLHDEDANLRVPRSDAPFLTGMASSSTSRSPSPHQRPLPEQPKPAPAFAGGPRPLQDGGKNESNGSGRVSIPLPLPPRPLPATSAANPSRQLPVSSTSARPEAMDESDDIITPVQPSEKALGKRRAVSNHDIAFVSNGATSGGSSSAAPARKDSDKSHDESNEVQETVLRTRPPPALPTL